MLNLSCSNSGENLQKEKQELDFKILTLISQFRETGECLQIQTEQTKVNYICSKYNRGLCSVNLLITSSGKKNKILSEVATLLDKRPECSESIILSRIQNLSITSFEDEKKIKSENEFISVDNCSTIDFKNYQKLVTLSELIFLRSSRGRVGKEAEKIRSSFFFIEPQKKNAESCLQNEFTEAERTLLADIIANRKFEEDTYSILK